MGEIHPIADRLNAEGATRLIASLAQLFAGGTESSARGPRICALGLSLESLVEALRAELDRFGTCAMDVRLAASGHPPCKALLAEIERFADLARAYHAADTPDRPEA